MKERIWTGRGVALGVSAIAIGGVGEVLLFHEVYRGLGALLLFGAIVLGAIAWSGIRGRPLPTLKSPPNGILRWSTKAPAFPTLAVTGALLFSIGSILAWLADPNALFGWQGVLWLASIALLASAYTRWRPAYIASSPAQPWTRAERIIFCGIVLLALFTYLADLNDIPWRFHYDEAIAHNEAMRFYLGPQISLFTTTWYGTSLPSMWFALSGMLMHLGGTGLGGTRLGVALAGALTVIPLHGLTRLILGRTAAALAAFALATSPVAIHYSRVSINNMATTFFWTLCFYFLVRGLRSHHPQDYIWAGLTAGFSMYTYYGTRLLPYLLVAFVAYMAIFHFRAFRARTGHFALLGIGFVVGFGPLIAYFIRNPSMWLGRGLDQLNVPGVLPTSWNALASNWNTLAPLAWQNFLGLSVVPSGDHVYWAPLLSPAEAVLFLLGAGVLASRWRQPDTFLLLLWGAGVLLIGGTLIDRSHVPAFNHWTSAFPLFFIAIALPPVLLLASLRRISKTWWLYARGAVAGGMAVIAAGNAYFYLAIYPASVPPSYEAAQGRFLATLSPQDRVRFVGNSWQPYFPAIAEMMAPNVPASDFLNPSRELPLAPDPAHNLVFIFDDDETQYLPLMQQYYPGGKVEQIQSPGGPIAQTYQVSASVAMSQSLRPPAPNNQGLAATTNGTPPDHRIDPFVGAGAFGSTAVSGTSILSPTLLARDPDFVPLAPPSIGGNRISWEGEVYAEGGRYTMELRTDGHAFLQLDDTEALKVCGNIPFPGPEGVPIPGGFPPVTAEVDLTPGWHHVRLDLDATPIGNANGLEWTWTRPNGVREIVPPSRLRYDTNPSPTSDPIWPQTPQGVKCAP